MLNVKKKQHVNNCNRIKRYSYPFRQTLFPNHPLTSISSHDKTSQTLKPANNIPNPTKKPRYATTCTPTRGKSEGVWSIDRPQLTPQTPKKVPQKISLDHEGGMVIALYSVVGGQARGEVTYPADKSKTMPRESNIDATRSKHETNTGTHYNSQRLSLTTKVKIFNN